MIIHRVPTRLEQLIQLLTVTWDGDLIHKTGRDGLVKRGLAINRDGWNVITPEGIGVLESIGAIHC